MMSNKPRPVLVPMLGARQLLIATRLIEAEDYVRFTSLAERESLRRMNAKGLVARHPKDAWSYKLTEKGEKSFVHTCNSLAQIENNR